jgi:hypothetical protein
MNTLTAYQTAMVLDWLLDIGPIDEGQSISDSEAVSMANRLIDGPLSQLW